MTLKKVMRKSVAPQKGFTLIEMVIVLAIIALLMLIIVPNLNTQRKSAHERQSAALVTVVQNQAEMYINDFDVKDPSKVTVELLEDKGYLTSKQAKQANDENIQTVKPDKNNAKPAS